MDWRAPSTMECFFPQCFCCLSAIDLVLVCDHIVNNVVLCLNELAIIMVDLSQ